MCRWLAYAGNPIQLETVLFGATHSLIDQSLHSRMGATTAIAQQVMAAFLQISKYR